MKQVGDFGITLFAAAMWGLSGTAAQILFQRYGFPPFGLVMLRCLIAGIVLLALFRPKWPRKSSMPLILFAIFGVLPSQIFYFLTINYSNIVVALLLQYLFLPMIVVYEFFTGHFRMTSMRVGSILAVMFGVVLLVMGGAQGFQLSVTPLALFTGTLSALGVAYYTISSRPLIKKYGTWSISTWGFLIVGLISIPFGTLSFAGMPIAPVSQNLFFVSFLVLVVAILGTLLAYSLFLRGVSRLSGTEAGVAASTEPIFAAVASYLIFGSLMSDLQYLGGTIMIIAVVVFRSLGDGTGLKKTAQMTD